MTPQERRLDEQWPTGTFGDAQPTPRPSRSRTRPWTPQEQLDHRRALEQALNTWTYDEDTRTPHTTRHLHPVPKSDAA